ncbi:MAG: S8 family serine peptidase [Lachnospiraceae bacterium]|nr:S8 family serine peptidase [Lachnospiraceae bacterium]
MANQKAETILNLALETPLAERVRSGNLNVGYSVTARTWEFIVKYNGSLREVAEDFPGVVAEELIAGYGILTVPENLVEPVLTRPEIEYVEIPKRLYFSDFQARNASCILQVTEGYPNLTGKGVAVAVIDSGIDYTLPHFRNADGSTRILALWDQGQSTSSQYPPPEGFSQGRLYTESDINAVLQAANGAEEEQGIGIGVPALLSEDTSGHGTAVAGIAASGTVENYQGVAPESSLVVVKLANTDRESFPRTTELMRALTFVIRFTAERRLPVAINLSFGNSYGSHNGGSILERFIDNISEIGRSVICIGTGNEGASGGHFAATVQPGQPLNVEFAVASYEAALNLQIWKNYIDRYRIIITAPTGASLIIQEELLGQTEAVLERTKLLVYVGEPKPYTTNQEIYIDFLPQRTYVDSGVWTITLEPLEVKNGYIYMYLPSEAARSAGTRFVSSTPEVTLTIPSTATRAIAVGAYNSVYNAYADFSGRGYVAQGVGLAEREIGSVRPTLVAPGVSLQAVTPGGTYQYVSGTSFATPVVAGSAALLMEWGIVREQDIFMYGEKVKASLIRGARRFPTPSQWPNEMYGWGALCLADSF